jgi:hypothetical protein
MSRQGTQWHGDSKRQQAGQANRRDERLLTITRILPQESQLDAGTLFKFPSSPGHKLRHDSRIANTAWRGDAAVSWPRRPYSRNPPTSDVRIDGCEEAGEFAPERILSTHKKRKVMKRRPRFPICIGTTLK